MKLNKLIYAAVLLLLVFASANGAPRSSSKSTITMVYTALPNGDWVMHLYGGYERELVCEHPIQLIEPKEPAVEPLELRCRR